MLESVSGGSDALPSSHDLFRRVTLDHGAITRFGWNRLGQRGPSSFEAFLASLAVSAGWLGAAISREVLPATIWYECCITHGSTFIQSRSVL